MKKLRNLLGLAGLLAIVFSFAALFINPQTADAATTRIILHKLKMTELPEQDIQNTGVEMPELTDTYEPLPYIFFNAYDMTAEFYTARAAGQTAEEATATVQALTPTKAASASGLTNAAGQLTFNLQSTSTDASGTVRDAVYLIVERPTANVTTAANMVVVLPTYALQHDANGNVVLGDDGELVYTDDLLGSTTAPIHLYPKNEVAEPGHLTVTKVGSAEGEQLPGAVFNISRVVLLSTQYLSGASNGFYTWSTNAADAYSFVTGNNYDVGDTEITVTARPAASGVLDIASLEVGNYTLTETTPPDNAMLITNQISSGFAITADSTTAVTKTVTNDTLNAEKTVSSQSADIGERAQYSISANVPLGIADTLSGGGNRYTRFTLQDSHSASLTFDNTGSGDYAYQLTAVAANGTETVITADNYTVTEDGNGFTVAVNAAYIPSLPAGGTLRFDYYMYLNEAALPGTPYTNTANVEGGNDIDSITDFTPPGTELYTGGFKFKKIDAATNAALADAVFVVRDANSDNANYMVVDPDTKAVTWSTEETAATQFTSGADGLIDIVGLSYATYYLEEVTAPADYVLLADRIAFTVTASSHENTATANVANKHKGVLPATGGIGIWVYLSAGLIGLGLVVFYFKKRSARQES